MNITNAILQNASMFIPNKNVLVRPHEPPWITNEIKLNKKKEKTVQVGETNQQRKLFA